ERDRCGEGAVHLDSEDGFFSDERRAHVGFVTVGPPRRDARMLEHAQENADVALFDGAKDHPTSFITSTASSAPMTRNPTATPMSKPRLGPFGGRATTGTCCATFGGGAGS